MSNLTGKSVSQKPGAKAGDPERLGKVAAMPCVICHEFNLFQISRTQVHHCIHGRYGTSRAPDSMTIPLCEGHHTGLMDKTKIALHNGKETWREKYGNDADWLSWVEGRISNGKS